MKNIAILRDNGFITRITTGGWGSPLVLAPKPHQETVIDINKFVWRMCVSYRGLNKYTNPFQFPIRRCDAVLEDIGDGAGKLYFLSLDAAQGYNHIKVKKTDREKLAFFGPDGFKWTYTVLPFGPVNAPAFYTMVQRTIQDEATHLFRLLCNEAEVPLQPLRSHQPDLVVSALPRTDDYSLSCSATHLPSLELDKHYVTTHSNDPIFDANTQVTPLTGGDLTVRQKMRNSDRVHVTGSVVITDDLKIRSTSLSLGLLLLECYFRIYFKYRVTLKLPKCNFLFDRFEFVGHDILSTRNTTAKSKYDLITDWKLPSTADGLHSFVALCNFYQKFLPMFSIKVEPLRSLYAKYLHKQLPPQEWTEDRKLLFESLKTDLTSSPVLARYDSTKPIFIKTDWSALGMSFILMQPCDDEQSRAATKLLLETGECLFDVNLSGARLQAIHCGMRSCTEPESHYHSFVGEIAACRWAISTCRQYLWGCRFWVFCDMKSLYRILTYDGPIHCLRRWCQELHAYNMTPVHRPQSLMKDVDALNRGPYHRIVATYYAMSTSLRYRGQSMNPHAYDPAALDTVMSSGIYSMKRVCSFRVTPTDKLQAAVLLTHIATYTRSSSGDLSALVTSSLPIFSSPTKVTPPCLVDPTRLVNSPRLVGSPRLVDSPRLAASFRPLDPVLGNPRLVDSPRLAASFCPLNPVLGNPRLVNTPCLDDSPRLYSAAALSSDLDLAHAPCLANSSPQADVFTSFNPNTKRDSTSISCHIDINTRPTTRPKISCLLPTCLHSAPRVGTTPSTIGLPLPLRSEVNTMNHVIDQHATNLTSPSLHTATICSFAAVPASSSSAHRIFDNVRTTHCPSGSSIQHRMTHHLGHTPSESVDKFMQTYLLHWVSLQPTIATFPLHLSRILPHRLDCTIIEPSSYFCAVNQSLYPESAIVNTTVEIFHQHVLSCTPDSHCGPFTLRQMIYPSVDFLPISASSYTIDGVDISIEHLVPLPLPSVLDETLTSAITLVQDLRTLRNLSTFVWFCNLHPLANITSSPDITSLQHALLHWVVTAQIVYAPFHGDPIAARRLLIIGTHTSSLTTSADKLTFPVSDAVPICSLDSFLDPMLNIPAFCSQTFPLSDLLPHLDSTPLTSPCLLHSASTHMTKHPNPILHPGHPGLENMNCRHDSTFFTPYFDSSRSCVRIRRVSHTEIFRLYLSGLPTSHLHSLSHLIVHNNVVTHMTGATCPWHLASSIASALYTSRLRDALHHHDISQYRIVQCLVTLPVPTSSTWAKAYASDKDTNYILSRVSKDNFVWKDHDIRRVHDAYRQHLRDNQVFFRHSRLVIFHPIGSSHRFLSLIVVPVSLRQTIFHAYHTTAVGAHMGKAKTLMAIRTRFFWPGQRKDIMLWCDACLACIPNRVPGRDNSGLVYSWPVTTPFAIISVDIWMPGQVTTKGGYTCLFNAMCDMTQFVVCQGAKCKKAPYLAHLFMEGVLLTFGLCVVVVVDQAGENRGIFEKMCGKLNIKVHAVAKLNHKALGVERFHKFLNKAQTICTEERGTTEAFVECGKCTAYAWNASHIDGTDIPRSIPAIGRALKFPIEISNADPLQPIDSPSTSVATYLRLLGEDVAFARNLVAWIVTDRRTAHRERVNASHTHIEYVPGDLVMARVAVSSNAAAGICGKLVFRSKGPFVVVSSSGASTYKLRRYGKDTAPLQKFHVNDLYLLPKSILPCDHVDTADLRYINSDIAPLRHPLSDAYDIEGYNIRWFNDEIQSTAPTFIADTPAITEHGPSTTIPLSDAFTVDDDGTAVAKPIPASSPSAPYASFLAALSTSVDKLCFIQFVATSTLQPKWFLVQVELPDQVSVTPTSSLFCTFLRRHSTDVGKSDNMARWWPEWRELKWNNDDTFEYGAILQRDSRYKPHIDKARKYGTTVDFASPSPLLVGPFDFLPKGHRRAGSSYIDATHFIALADACVDCNIVPPVLSPSHNRVTAQASFYGNRLG